MAAVVVVVVEVPAEAAELIDALDVVVFIVMLCSRSTDDDTLSWLCISIHLVSRDENEHQG